MTRRAARFLAFFGLLLLAAAGGLDNYLQFHNTLARGGRWIGSKLRMAVHPVGSVEFMFTTLPLRRDVLNLGSCWGFQEVLSGAPVRPARVDFDFRCEDAFVVFIFNRGEDRFEGLRLSSERSSDSGYFKATTEGMFLSRVPLAVPRWGGGWNRFSIFSVGGGLEVRINDVSLGTVPARFETGQIGFRGSARPVWVDNIRVWDAEGKVLLRESFGHWKGLRRRAVWAAGLGLLAGFLAWYGSRDWRWGRRISVLALFAAAQWLLSLANFYVPWRPDPPRHEVDVQRARCRAPALFSEHTGYRGEDQLPENFSKNFSGGPAPGVFRILLLGTSQTAGAGAHRVERAFVPRLKALLNERVVPGRRYECLNGSIAGVKAEEILKLYDGEWKSLLKPDMVIFNLSPPGDNPDELMVPMIRFLEKNRGEGIRTILVCEARYVSRTKSRWNRYVKQLGESFGVPVVDMHEHLLKHAADGFLWWDDSHFTPYAHGLVAERLREAVEAFLGDEKNGRKARGRT